MMNPPPTIVILNVDDEHGARYAKTRVLQNAGFTVIEAVNGTQALEMVQSHDPDLVLLDVRLPDINGLEVCRRIKSDPASAAVLILQTSAALTQREDRIRGLEGGADNYLVTPLEADELVANVRALLRLRSTQKQLRDSEERFRQFAENIADVFWMLDAQDSSVLYVSPAYESMWESSTEKLLAEKDDWLASVHAEDRERVADRFAGLVNEELYDEEFRLQLSEGRMRWVRDRAFPVRNARDEVYRIARITSDISNLKEMEALLRAADSNKDEFLATLAHELRNPLGPIRNAVALMDKSGDGQPEVQQKSRDIIRRQVDHLAHLVDDLLDVARISRGKIALRLADVNLTALVASAADSSSSILQGRNLTWSVNVPESSVWVSGDGVRLAQSVGNLIHNAAKFTPSGGHVDIGLDIAEPMATITVRDNGIGIAPENLTQIFDMFVQSGPAPDKASEGLGIGLSLASRLISMHGGSIHASSAGINQGSTFSIQLPILRVDQSPQAADTPAALQSAGKDVLRILVVDDNQDAVEMLSMLLAALGHITFTARDSASAIDGALQHLPDVIILDIGLPVVDGYQTARLLREQPALAATRLIALTGYGSQQDRDKAREAGFDAHIAKPAELDHLLEALAPSLAQKL
ncbi:response regulator [Undibacterium sp. TJN25]|uniref:hybrid sensor histidine kinase/response regulator n=1 Tax=Undibacterium sp. TJN25 TaxID=3413056 RepID=UPI003BEFF325